jgi:predicted short-subunit dehydrogenase-like oxidoreductase (DUF2520 family)
MKKAKSVGLIAGGNLTDSPLTRLGKLSESLGPVKSPSYRVASQFANLLRSGHPVKDYAEFERCRLVLVSVPDEQVPQVVSDMLASPVAWRQKAVVLCSTWLGSAELRELALRGASVGSLSPIPGFDELRYLVEGDRLAVLESRRIVEDRNRRLVAIERSLKPFYLAALTCTGSLLFALLLAASESLRHAGLPPALRATVLERQLSQTLRSFAKGSRRAFPVPRKLTQQLLALTAKDPELANYLEQSCRLASRLVEKRSNEL